MNRPAQPQPSARDSEGSTVVAPGPAAGSGPVAIEARNVRKSFRIPTHRVDSLKERVVRPFSAGDVRILRALDGISFDVHRGEFFGIVGRNGSGKSTLLKLLASIYRADGGTIRMAGRLAPFIELGVGFNPELTARENVVLNGVMMGLTPRETKRRLGAVLDFAELEQFADLKLKNYSSGMLVRLAFSVMLQSDADILLIDEVLAVGDAAFQQKCADAFRGMKGEGKTIVLVTHDMRAVEDYCHRAMLIDDGRVRLLGDPAEVGRRYMRLNFEREVAESERPPDESEAVRFRDAGPVNARGERVEGFATGEDVRLRVTLEAVADLERIGVAFMVTDANGVQVLEFGSKVRGADGSQRVRAGERVMVRARFDNRLTPGRYFVHCGINRTDVGTALLHVHNAVDFVVFGDRANGIVRLDHEVSAQVEAAA